MSEAASPGEAQTVPRTAGWKLVWQENMKPPNFPERSHGDELSDTNYAKELRKFATDWVEFFIAYYEKRARRCRVGAIGIWPAPGSADTELGVLMEPEVGHGTTEVYA